MAASERKTSPGKLVRILAAAFVGTAIGAITFATAYAGAPSYLGSAPETCANCHVMQPYYDAWAVGTHRNGATCNDCHVPHGSVFSKYKFKVEDGLRHSASFTFGKYSSNLQIRESSLATVNDNCLSCHLPMTEDLFITKNGNQTDVTCSRCHARVGHPL